MLLRQNSELRKDRIWNWTLPAWRVTLPDGRGFNVCPNAGPCAQYCYARNGTYLFPKVREAHMRNLSMVLDDREGWVAAMLAELADKRFRPTGLTRSLPDGVEIVDDPWMDWWIDEGGAAVRIHDSGDFFDADYLADWMRIAEEIPDVLFYAYTKEVSLLKAVTSTPPNFRWLYSMGGLEDHLIDVDVDRHADVFPDAETTKAAGYESQDANDLLCVVLASNRVGITANNIRHFNKRMNGRRFSELHPNRKV